MKKGTLGYPLMDMVPAPFAFHRGKMVPFEDAVVPLDSPAVLEAYTVFGLMVACWNEAQGQLYVHRLDRHCERLLESMRIALMPLVYPRRETEAAILETLRHNGIRGKDLTVRILAYMGDGDDGPSGVGLTVLVHVRGGPFVSDIEPREIWTGWRRRIPDCALPPRVKASANYENGRISGGDYYLNLRGKVSEMLTSSIFLVRGGTATTARLQDDQLESITRDTFLRLLKEVHDIPVQIREVDRTELYLAEEIWGGASGTGIFPVVKVDGRQVGEGKPGPIFEALKKSFHAVHLGSTDLYPEWRTPVY